jgi:hypothetical protein
LLLSRLMATETRCNIGSHAIRFATLWTASLAEGAAFGNISLPLGEAGHIVKRRPSFLATLLANLGKSEAASPPQPVKVVRPFQAVSIHTGTVCCPAAKELGGKRFLARSAPSLPLAKCTLDAKCACRFTKHSDRRDGARRIVEFGVQAMLFEAKDRRATRGRRAKDK